MRITVLGAGAWGTALAKVLDWLRGWNERFGVPSRLRDLSFPEADRDEILDRSLDDHCHLTNARPCQRADLEELWERAW